MVLGICLGCSQGTLQLTVKIVGMPRKMDLELDKMQGMVLRDW